jgi:hypothetical protein
MNNEELLARLHEINPFEFEKFCAELWRRQGWEANVTQETQDKGVDVLLYRDEGGFSRAAVMQVKRYGKITARQFIVLVVLISVLAVGGLATPAAADSSDAESTNDGVTVEEGELVCVPGTPVSCYFVGTRTEIDTDELRVTTDNGAVTFDDTGQAFAGATVDVTADIDDILVDGEVCYLAPENDRRECLG